MSNIVTAHNVICAAGVSAAAPTESVLDPNISGTLVLIRLVIPDGHNGLTGIAFGYGHTPVIPLNGLAFISGNDEVIPFELDGYPIGVPWSAFTCNNGQISHSWQVRCEYNNIVSPSVPPPAAPLDTADINAAALAAVSGP